MTSNIEIFDKNGNQLDINAVIVQYLKEQAANLSHSSIAANEESNGVDADDITVGIDFDDNVKYETTLMIYDQEFSSLDSIVIKNK